MPPVSRWPRIAPTVCFALACVLALHPLSSSAATDGSSRLAIAVVDFDTGKPVSLATVRIYGSRNLAAVTNMRGEAAFSDISPGTYRLTVEHYGYKFFTVETVEIKDDQDLTMTVHLAAAGLKVIGSVTTHAKPRASISSVTSTSIPYQLTSSLLSALGSLPGAVLGPGQALSVNGHLPSETGLSVNGAPVALGAAPNLGGLDTSALTSGSIDTSAADGSIGGTVNFSSALPTLAWVGSAREVASRYGGNDLAFGEQGTSGRIGIAFARAQSTVGDPLDGTIFRDTSGLLYSHDADAQVTGNAVTLRYPFSMKDVLFASGVAISATEPLVCRVQSGLLPCGYGPLNVDRSNLNSYQLRDVMTLGLSQAEISIFDSSVRQYVDRSGFFLNGVNEPSTSDLNVRTSGFSLQSEIAISTHRKVTLSVMSAWQSSATRGSAFGTILPLAPLPSLHFTTAALSVPVISAGNFSLNAAITAQGTSAGATHQNNAGGRLSTSYRLSSADGLSASYATGMSAVPGNMYKGVSAPSGLQYNCANHNALGSGPVSTSAGTRSTQTTLSWSHDAARYSAQLSLSHDTDRDEPISAVVAASELPASYFAEPYFMQAQQIYASICGGASLGFSGLYYQTTGIADRVERNVIAASATIDLSPNVLLVPSYSLVSARAYGNDAVLFGSGSTVIAGRQLPGVPIQTASLAAAAAIGHGGLRALFDTSYSSTNNPYNLPAYALVSAGLLVPLPRATLAFSMTNVFGSHEGPFARAAGSVALPMGTGAFPTLAQPLPARNVYIGYRVHIGPPDEQPISFAAPGLKMQPTAANTRFILYPLGSGSKDLLGIDRESPACGPENVGPSGSLLTFVKSYIAKIESARTAAGYPATFAPAIQGPLEVLYRKLGTSYAVFFTNAPGTSEKDLYSSLRAVQGCWFVHFMSRSQAIAGHYYMLTKEDEHAHLDGLIYQPVVGFFYAVQAVAPPSHPVEENGAQASAQATHFVNSLPAAPPPQPFALGSSKTCSAEMKPAAAELLSEMQTYVHAYYDLHQKPQNPSNAIITPHVSRAGTWLEIRTPDLNALNLLQQCMKVDLIGRGTLQRSGWDGGSEQELNYAPPIGLYQVF